MGSCQVAVCVGGMVLERFSAMEAVMERGTEGKCTPLPVAAKQSVAPPRRVVFAAGNAGRRWLCRLQGILTYYGAKQ